ncbi:MAG: response regulator [Deltaproteobacteria bacterium]|nr:response regulator [Deltaproteobacteria bacterium]
MMSEAARMVDILMVEDNPHDVRLTMEAFKDAGVPNVLSVAKDGEEALRFLRREGPYLDAPRPDLILLDLNLPRKSGREVLEEIKKDPDLKRIPIVVLTTSGNEEDIRLAYELHVNAYITKPMDLDHFIRIVGAVGDFWLRAAVLPPK